MPPIKPESINPSVQQKDAAIEARRKGISASRKLRAIVPGEFTGPVWHSPIARTRLESQPEGEGMQFWVQATPNGHTELLGEMTHTRSGRTYGVGHPASLFNSDTMINDVPFGLEAEYIDAAVARGYYERVIDTLELIEGEIQRQRVGEKVIQGHR